MKWIVKNKNNSQEFIVESNFHESDPNFQKMTSIEKSKPTAMQYVIGLKRNQRFFSFFRRKDEENALVLEQNFRWRSFSKTKSSDESFTTVELEYQGHFENTLVISTNLSIDTYYEGLENRSRSSSNDKLLLKSPITGKVLKLLVKQGDTVKKGDVLLTVEAMKMENRIQSPQDGILKSVKIQAGSSVRSGQVLVEIAPV